MLQSAAEEMRQWAEQCRRWAMGARTREQGRTLRGLEKILRQAAIEAERDLNRKSARPLARTKS